MLLSEQFAVNAMLGYMRWWIYNGPDGSLNYGGIDVSVGFVNKSVVSEKGSQLEAYTVSRGLLTDINLYNNDSVHIPYCPILVQFFCESKTCSYNNGWSPLAFLSWTTMVQPCIMLMLS